MARDVKGYVDPLLSGFAVDYASIFAKDLVGPLLAPAIPITKPDAQYAYFGANVYAQLPNTELARNGGKPNRVGGRGEKLPVNAIDHGLDMAIDKRDAEFEDAPFAPSERRAVRSLVSRLSLAHDRRVRDKLLAETGRSESLQGNGTEEINKWSGRGGDPVKKVENRKGEMIVDPNLMVMGRNVWQALRRNPKIIARVGEVQTTKVVTLATLCALFDIGRVVVARGQIGGKKENKSGDAGLSYIWDDLCVMAYVADDISDESLTVAATFYVRYPEAGDEMWLVRTYDDESSGMRGSRIIFAGNTSEEKIVCPKAFWAIKSVV